MIVVDFIFQAAFLLLAASIVILTGWVVFRLIIFVIEIILMIFEEKQR